LGISFLLPRAETWGNAYSCGCDFHRYGWCGKPKTGEVTPHGLDRRARLEFRQILANRKAYLRETDTWKSQISPREQVALRPPLLKPPEVATWMKAEVGWDGYFHAGGARYTVPSPYVGKEVMVRLTSKVVEAYYGCDLIKTHARVDEGQHSTDWNDFPPERRLSSAALQNWRRERAAGRRRSPTGEGVHLKPRQERE